MYTTTSSCSNTKEKLGFAIPHHKESILSTSISKSNHTINFIHIHSYAPVQRSQNVFKWLCMQSAQRFLLFLGVQHILVRPVTCHSTQQAIFQHKTGELAPNFSTLLEVQRSLLTVHYSMRRKLQTLPTIVNLVAWQQWDESVSSSYNLQTKLFAQCCTELAHVRSVCFPY